MARIGIVDRYHEAGQVVSIVATIETRNGAGHKVNSSRDRPVKLQRQAGRTGTVLVQLNVAAVLGNDIKGAVLANGYAWKIRAAAVDDTCLCWPCTSRICRAS